MFKAIGDFLNRTPWWALLIAGVATLALLVLFALPVHVIRLIDSGQNPAENNAIQREIGLAVGDRALTMAKGVVSAMKERSTDPARRDELNRTLAEIERARDELTRAQNSAVADAVDAAREATDSALENARDSAESAVEAAREAREAVEEARSDALDRLRDKGLDISSAQHSFDQLVAAARDNEKAAVESLAALRALPQDERSTPVLAPPKAPTVVPPAPPMPAIPSLPVLPPVPKSATSGIGPGLTIDISPSKSKLFRALSDERRSDIRAQVGGDVWRVATGSVLILVFIPLFVTLMIAKFFIGRSRRAMAIADRKTREAEISDVSRQVTEARLQALQAQVEPHFLYNTLANVQALNEVDPPAANLMVGHLIQYLRASLPKMRESTSTIGQELELVRAYLNILQMRMGDRLSFDIRANADLLACAFPPMMLPSLVENAIKHGLEPLREGGRIDVVVERLLTPGGDRLLVQVLDTGKGLADATIQAGSGVGLSNLRERLNAIYGADGRFTLVTQEPQGVAAAIEIPLQTPADYAAKLPQGLAVPAIAAAEPTPRKGWRKVWYATSATHSLWVRLLLRTFMVLMVLLAGLLLAAFIGLLTGWMPVQMGDVQLDGMEGLAVGSIGLLFGFGAAALAVVIIVAVVYGLGFLFAALLILIPSAILIALFPVLSPFILLGLLMWWIVRRRRV